MTPEECREFYKDHKKELETIFGKSNELFEKQLSYISAGALGLTFVLIEKVVKDIGVTTHRWMLILSWICLTLTLFINLVSHLFTAYLHSKSISEIQTGNFNNTTGDKRNDSIDKVNILSVVLLFIGIVLFIVYTSINVINMKPEVKNERDVQQEGIRSTPAPKPPVTSTPVVTPQPTTSQPTTPKQ